MYIYTCDGRFSKFILNTTLGSFCNELSKILLYSFYFYEVVLSKFENCLLMVLVLHTQTFLFGTQQSRGVGQITSNVVTFSIDVTMMIFLFFIIALVKSQGCQLRWNHFGKKLHYYRYLHLMEMIFYYSSYWIFFFKTCLNYQ